MAELDTKTGKIIQGIIEASNEMSTDFYQALQEKAENFIVSSLSTHIGISMLRAGADGFTAREMDTVLKLPIEAKNKKIIAKSYAELLGKYDQPGESDSFELILANGLFVESLRMGVGETGVKKEFSDLIEDDYGSNVTEVLFELNDMTADMINTWISRNVRDTFRDLMKSSDVDKDSVLLLFSACYFKGKWKTPFDVSNTTQQDFYLDPNENSKEVDMMKLKSEFPYCVWKELDAHAVAIPFQGTEGMYMLVYIPINRPKEESMNGLTSLESRLKDWSPEEILESMELKTVRLSLPRFNIESKIGVEDYLKKRGIKNLFDDEKAELTGIANFTIPEDRLFLSEMIQTAWIDICEIGTNMVGGGRTNDEIADVTSARARSRPVPVTFTADHPFIYQIVDAEKNLILFSGRCVNPMKKSQIAAGIEGEGDFNRQFLEKLTI